MIVRDKSTLRIRFYLLHSAAVLIFLIHGYHDVNFYSWVVTMSIVFFLGYKATISTCETCGKGVQWSDEPGYVRQFTGAGGNLFGLMNKCPYCEIKRY